MDPDQLRFENEMVLDLVQALLGCVSPEFRAIAFSSDVGDQAVDLHIALESPVADMDDLIYDLELSFAALNAGSVLLRSHIWIGHNWTEEWPGRTGRRIFASRLPI